ncbi:hypothetical protein FC12_GL001377 [Lacticaseibacillus paracasei subsp. tolerans DSM 20258]|nr:hypothetical protein FC12_GL001377 [Lacticaseibacillus paracasei subsp. tolerans DSM 20258]GEL38048.1 hypothetical protein LPA06_08990 [Lacticaseibacillus paracasei subsp. tolerans]
MTLKTIFHLDTTQRWPHLASNLDNYLAAEPDADIEVLVNGDGITVFFDQKVAAFIAAHPQVHFFACHNSLQQRHLDETNYRLAYQWCQLALLNWHKLRRLGMGILSLKNRPAHFEPALLYGRGHVIEEKVLIMPSPLSAVPC